MDDPFGLGRFVNAQDPVYRQVTDELRAGRKQSHWMWFIFPQLKGLGHSPAATYYGISGMEEARAYLAHAALGPRLNACTDLALAIDGNDPTAVFGSPDDLKFRSSMTLFASLGQTGNPFGPAIDKFYGGQPDQATLDLLGKAGK